MDEANGLELVARGEAETDDCSSGDVGAADGAPGAVIGDREQSEGQRHADEVEGRG